jgi:hypothetical protein
MFSLLVSYYDACNAEKDTKKTWQDCTRHHHGEIAVLGMRKRAFGNAEVGSQEHATLKKELDEAEGEHAVAIIRQTFALKAHYHAIDYKYWCLNHLSRYEYMGNSGLRNIPAKWTRVIKPKVEA